MTKINISEVPRPLRANPADAGLDIFYTGDEVNIGPGENRIMSTGMKAEIPHGYMLQVCNRSSVAAKRSLVVGAHIIDSGYSGEIFIDMHNIGLYSQVIAKGDKIAQLVMVPVVPFRVLYTDEENLYSDPVTISNRDEGALGSTGN